MPNTVIALKSSGTASSEPDVGTLANGELALNFADGILFYKTSTGTLGTISSGGSGTPGGLDTEVQFNDSGSFGGNSFFTFDKTTGTVNVSNVVVTNTITTGTGSGGIITGANVIYSNTFIANTGSGGVIAGANVIYSNTFVANTGGYIEFADGTKQYTANAGGGGSDQTARDTANAAFDHANGSFGHANGSFDSSNSIINGTVTIKANIDSDSITANSITINVSSQLFSLGVGTPSSGVEGEIRAANDVTAFYSSDIRLKENVVQISHALEKVMQINGVHFDWKDDYIEERGGEDGFFVRKNNIGIIAQEIEKVLPEIVVTKSNGYKAVRYELIVALLIQAIKELNEKIDKMSK